MVHLFWSGRGWIVPAFAFGSSLAGGLITSCVTGSLAYWDSHPWPMGIAMLVCGPPCWFIGRRFRNQPPRRLIDAETGEAVILRPSHTCLFIPVMWWGPILTAAGFFTLSLEMWKK